MFKKTTLVIFVLLGVVACKPIIKNDKPVTEMQCLASQSRCFFTSEFGQISVQFDREKIITEEPFNIIVKLLNTNKVAAQKINKAFAVEKSTPRYQIESINSFMEGTNMFMGKIPLMFKENINKSTLEQKFGEYKAHTMLGSCSEEQMIWRLWLTITIKDLKDNQLTDKRIHVDFNASRH